MQQPERIPLRPPRLFHLCDPLRKNAVAVADMTVESYGKSIFAEDAEGTETAAENAEESNFMKIVRGTRFACPKGNVVRAAIALSNF